MIQKVVLEIESEKMLSEYGDRHVILYDEKKGRYYVQTREKFLSEQTQEMKKLKKRIEDSEKKIEQYIEEADEKYKNFLQTYSEINEKVLGLVSSVVEV